MKKYIYRLMCLATLMFCLPRVNMATHHIITAADFQFSPDTLTVESGDTVTWQWESGFHTTTANGIPDGAMQWNEILDSTHTSFSYVVTVAGTYHYISIPDLPSMAGRFTLPGPAGINPVVQSPFSFELMGNPVRDRAVISYVSRITAAAVFTMYDQLGKKVQTITGTTILAGKHTYALNFDDVFPAGMYFIMMQVDDVALTRKLVIQ